MNTVIERTNLIIAAVAMILIATSASLAQDRRADAEKAIAEAETLRKLQTADAQKAALTKYDEALIIWREIGDRTKEAETLQSIGAIHQRTGDAGKALDYFERSLALAQLLGNKALEADALLTFGQAYGQFGDNVKAAESYQKALFLAREIKDQKLEAIAIVSLGFGADARGDKQAALNYYNQALPIVRAINDKQGQAAVLINLGAVYFSLGEISRAIDNFRDSLPIVKELGDERREAVIYNNIGAAYEKMADKPSAIASYEKGLAIRIKIGDRLGEAVVLGNLAGAYDELGDKPKSLTLYERSLAIVQQLKARNIEATTLSNIGRLYYSMNDHQKAFEYFSLSLPIRREVSDIFGEAKTLSNLAAIEKIRGNFAEALRLSSETIAIFDSVRATLASQEVRSTYFASVQEYYGFHIDLLMAMHERQPDKGFDRLALETVERSRARNLLDTLGEARIDIRKGVDPKLIERERSLQKELNAKVSARRALTTGPKAEAADKEIDKITTAYQDLRAEIQRTSPQYSAFTHPKPIGVGEIQKLLDDETLLLEYSLGSSRSYLWVVSSDSVRSYALPNKTTVEAKAVAFYEAAKNPKTASVAQTAGADLSKMIIEPARSALGSKRLVIVTDGVLGYVPFAALSSAVGDVPLVSGHEISYLPSASTLAVLRSDDLGRGTPNKTIAVIADPVFDASDKRVGRKGGELPLSAPDSPVNNATRDAGIAGVLPRLPATRGEAAAILSFVPAGDRKRAIDFDANLAAVNDPGLADFKIIHFATHGIVNSVHPELSGIVLSLVDKTGKPQDGFLRLNDIYDLKLPADLVVLSACHTALGKVVKGEGLISLTRGFMYAGTKRVVASQWAVSDDATSELMKHFYQGMFGPEKLKPAAALRRAQLAIMKDKRFTAPFYWSAFTIQGEWR